MNFAFGKLMIEYSLADSEIVRMVKQAGFEAVREEKTRRQPAAATPWWKNIRTQATFCSGMLLALATVMDWTATALEYTDYLFGLAAIVGGFHAAKIGLYGIRAL